MVVCFVLLLSSIHYMYDYIKNEFTETREVPTFNDYTKKDIHNKEDSNENVKKQKREKLMKKEIIKDNAHESDTIILPESDKRKKHDDNIENSSIEQDYTPIFQLETPIEQNVDNIVSSIPVISSIDHKENKKETNELDDYFKSLH